GVADFVEAGRAFPDTDFIWFGPMNNRFLRAAAVTRNVKDAPDNVHFPGFVEEAREAFGVGDIFFFPSHEENQPIAVLEAMYCGLPLLVRDIAAFDWLEHGTHCLKAEDTDGLHTQLQRLIEDPELRDRLGENAQELAEEHTLEAVADDLQQAYDTVRGDR
ncbi:MAG: glycosyltransferase family 4 protein, partial [Candidatus Nanohaloarchaea archaeon]